MSNSELTDCFNHLDSDKISERKKYCAKLSSLLEHQDIINNINNGRNISWKMLVEALQTCLRKDAEKMVEDSKKKTTTSNSSAGYLSPDLFVQVVDRAIKEESKLDICTLVGYIIGCMNDPKMKKIYGNKFLAVLQKSVLLNPRCRSKLESEDWGELYIMLKKLLEECNQNVIISNCFLSLIKYGPTCGLSPLLLREDFDFLTKICQKVSHTSPRPLKEDTIEVILEFCKHTAKDNRASCCKFGEDIFTDLINLYELNGKPEKIKELLVQFFLLQMIIHHPNGVGEGSSIAYAYNWNQWKKILKHMYNIISKEINLYFKCYQKNSSFFKIVRDKTTVCPKFTRLFVELIKQLLMYPDLDVSMAVDSTFPSQKRQRTEFTLKTFIDNIQETKSWLWIYLVSSIIKKYPEVIEVDDYLSLLEILSSIQIEKNDHDIIENVYFCFSTMLHMENVLDTSFHKQKITNLWKQIGKSTTRAFGLNQHKDATESLLEELISRGITDFEDIFQTYQSGVINMSLQSIKTFHAGLRYMVLNNDLQKKERIMQCLLQSQNLRDYKYLCNKETAKFLIKLIMKQWTYDDQNLTTKETLLDEFDNLKEIYLKSLLDINSLVLDNNKETEKFQHCPDIDFPSSRILTEVIEEFVTSPSETEEVLFSKIILLANISSCLVEYQIMPKEQHDNCFMNLIEKLFGHKLVENFALDNLKTEKDVKRLIECVKILNVLFSLDVSQDVMTKLKELFPAVVLKKLFTVLTSLQENQKKNSLLHAKLKLDITQALSNFSCICGYSMNTTQKNVLEVLSDPKYNFDSEVDFNEFTAFLATVKLSEPGTLPDTILKNILQCVEEMCYVRYQEKAEYILRLLYDLFPHVSVCNDIEQKLRSVALLKPFYDNIKNNGPSVATALLDCFKILCELDHHNDFSKWNNIEIVRIVPNFLKSDFQEVRFKAVDVLVVYYSKSTEENIIEDIHRQEEVFLKICQVSIEVFDVNGITTDERRADEVISRTASVLLTFGNIATNCDNWTEDCIYALIKIAYNKNIASLDKIFNIINRRKFGNTDTNILDKYILGVVEKWINDKYNFEHFPYGLLNCGTKFEFYKKYFEECAAVFIMAKEDDIVKVAKELQVVDKVIIEKTAAKIFARIICNDTDTMTPDILEKNQILARYSKIIEDFQIKKALVEHLDQVVIGVLDFLTDEKDIQKCFGEHVIFFIKHLNVDEVKVCFNFVQAFLCTNQSLGLYLTENSLSNFENILLELKSNIHKSLIIKDKLKYLHRYLFFVEIIINTLKSDSSWRYFFIRDVIYTLFNVTENNEHCTVMLSATCKFLNDFLRKIIPTFAETFKDFFHDTVNSLKKFYHTRKAISSVCKDLLKFLIVNNINHFKEEIKTLGTFSDHDDFKEIRVVQKNVKYGDQEPLLVDEINQFLNHKDILTKEDSLIHLRKVLSSKKDQLKELYEKLQDIRGFSEDCENSLLHQMVCVLTQLSYSANQNVSFEAARCLGEIGPANLQTLVLQLEKQVTNTKNSSFEIIVGSAISLLIKYIIDCDINVIKTASRMLYVTLHSKEGKIIVGSNSDFGYGVINKKYVVPYLPLKSTPSAQTVIVNVALFIEKLDDDEIWCPYENTSHEAWITTLVTNILDNFPDNSFLKKLIDVCNVKVDFCECLLPLIVDLLLSMNSRGIVILLSNKIEAFFTKHWNLTVQVQEEESIALNKKSVKCMLNIVNYVRLMKKCNNSKSSRARGELTVTYLKVAKAAEFCANHFSALYYAELWCQEVIEKIQRQNVNYCDQRSTMIDYIYENEDQQYSETLHNILRNAYKAIGDSDALPGCGISFLLQPKYRVEHYKEQGKVDQVIQLYANQSSGSSKELIDSFKSCGLYQIPVLCSRLEEPEYECLWRLGQWNFEEKKRSYTYSVPSYEDFEKYRFYSLKALHDNNKLALLEASKTQFSCVINHIKNISLESCHNLYPILTQLQSLVEIEDFSNTSTAEIIYQTIAKWKLQDRLIRENDFQYIEPIIAQRLLMLNNFLTKNDDSVDLVRKYIIDLSLDFANLAKEEGHFKEAFTILEKLKGTFALNNEIMTKIDILDAQLCWSVNNTLVARQILNRLCKNTEICPKLQATALKLTGHYMSETNSENRTTIIQDYFQKSITLMGTIRRDNNDIKTVMDTYDKLALFADREYVQIMAYMKSDLFQKKIATMEQCKKTATNIQMQRRITKEENKAAFMYNKNSNIDNQEIKTTKQDCNTFLKLALKYYLLCLIHSNDKDIRIFRIMSLFLENRKNQEITKTIQEHLPKLPSYKYIIMLPQLIPHLTLENDSDLFSKSVREIIEICALEHPHHTLPLLLSLSNAYQDRKFEDVTTKTFTNDGRIETAKQIIAKLSKGGLSEQIDKLNKVSLALIHLAYFKGNDDTSDKEYSIPKSQSIMKIKNFDDVLVPTYMLPISMNNNYPNIVGISYFAPTYVTVGGVNKPKKIMCRGTDGKNHSQLVKGQDDLRQDAVMQQVFSIMNNLLSYNKTTKHLLIRTYKIVPLSMRSGILKWADDSMPIGEYLTGSRKTPGAHQTYRPSDKLPNSCREMFKRCAGESPEEKLRVYKDICKSFKPVFHHFFEHFFPQPAVWYERRRAFIHSVATTSMCGYILGIGDRHTSNILIDKTTAEVIHIDFGIAFEQGRVLPTPETVPFRLTRDMVDAMGASGVEGIFRRSCERTMEVLRQNAQTIITILEVLLYDPLYAWTVTSAEASKRQTDSDSSVTSESNDSVEEPTNVSAERALLRLREKLQGTELGHPRSIEHQVGTLIQQAVDPANLCKLYAGWQPFV